VLFSLRGAFLSVYGVARYLLRHDRKVRNDVSHKDCLP